MRHRGNADDRRDPRIATGGQQARTGADRVAEQHHAIGFHARIVTEPTEPGVDVLREARHRREPIVVASTVTACVEEQGMGARAVDERCDGQHEARGTVPAVDDEHRRPGAIGAGTPGEPSLERAVIRSRDGDVLRVEGQVGRSDLEPRPPDLEDPGERPGRGPAHAVGEHRDRRDTGEQANRPSLEHRHDVARPQPVARWARTKQSRAITVPASVSTGRSTRSARSITRSLISAASRS